MNRSQCSTIRKFSKYLEIYKTISLYKKKRERETKCTFKYLPRLKNLPQLKKNCID